MTKNIMMKNLIKLSVATTLGLSALTAFAEDDMYRGAWYALPGISYNWTDSDLKADDDVGAFIRLGKEVSANWDIQVGGSYTRMDENRSPSTSGKYKQTLLGVDALYMLSRDKFRPFLLAGVGYARNQVDYVGWGGSKSSFMGNVGAGVQYLFSDNFGVQADLREVWSNAEIGNVGAMQNKTVGNTILNLGAIFRFGAPPIVVAKAPPVEKSPEPVMKEELAPEPVAPVIEPQPIAATTPCQPKTETITLQAEALFGFDKAAIKKDGQQLLKDIATKIKQHDDVELVMVTGYTDRIGSDAYNQKLSQRRANLVKQFLADQGINNAVIKAVGKGEADAIVDCKGVIGSKKVIECLAPNRRVIIDATHKQQAGC